MLELPEKLQARIMPEPNSGCWLWIGNINQDGYGRFAASRAVKDRFAHRLVWEALRGPIPQGLQLDHKCRVRCCVNPDHLEPVTCRENLRRGVGFPGVNARKTHCAKGHEFSESNTYWYGTKRRCIACMRSPERLAYWRAYNARHKGKSHAKRIFP